MNRKEFLTRSVALAGACIAGGKLGRLVAAGAPSVDLVAVKGGEPDVMFDKGIEALGGLQQFVARGAKVVVKPNIGWDVPPERGGNTNPRLVYHVVRRCFDAGARSVTVFDHTCDNWRHSYETSGIERAAKEAGAKVAPGNSASAYHEVSLPTGKRLRSAEVHELILESDTFINLPVLKSHSSAKLTIALKNLMGIVWDRGEWHREDLHQCIADFAADARKPDLNIVDAYNVMKRNGPRGVSVDDVVMMRSLLLSTDMVAADAAGARLLGYQPSDIPHIRIAAEQNVGRMDLENLNIKRITVS
jgi:uncharacterized protein (DUF362 family)